MLRSAVLFAILASSILLRPGASTESPGLHHELDVILTPKNHRILVTDTIHHRKLADRSELRFSLHANLAVESLDREVLLEESPDPTAGDSETEVPVKRYRLRPRDGWPANGQIRLSYEGAIDHPLAQVGAEGARSFSSTPGTISETGVYLSSSTAWFPLFPGEQMTFKMSVLLPGDWSVVSQGARQTIDAIQKKNERGETREKRRVVWDCPHPMEEVYLIAARFTEYTRSAGDVTVQAFLREEDEALANRYLDMTGKTLAMYSDLIGPYPYSKFALVENFWETGWGMPSFTLLGPRIIRFPFILYSSYPHEILHNWWGNSVYVDRETGNWCEGLTAYLADHLMKEMQGQGTGYRRDTLKKYLDFVRGSLDFPLREFRSRHSEATEAVGYGKSLMLWHMIRGEIGDEAFTAGLRLFYEKHRFRRASFDDLLGCFSKAAGTDLTPRFLPWVEREGAPTLHLAEVEVAPTGSGYRARVAVEQTQAAAPFSLGIPVAFTVEDGEEQVVRRMVLDDRRTTAEFDLPSRPMRVALDPEFDVFRILDRREIPPSIGQIFGADRITLVLPGSKDPVSLEAWTGLAKAFQRGRGDRVEIRSEEELTSLPADRAVWVLGTSNRWSEQLIPFLRPLDAGLQDGATRFGNASTAPLADHCFVYTATHPADPELAMGWIGAEVEASIPGLARKLPHYGKYSYLAFDGDAPTNRIKGQWPGVGSPLSRDLVEGSIPTKPRPGRRPLARLP